VAESLRDSQAHVDESLRDSQAHVAESLRDSQAHVAESLRDSQAHVDESLRDSQAHVAESLRDSQAHVDKSLRDSQNYHSPQRTDEPPLPTANEAYEAWDGEENLRESRSPSHAASPGETRPHDEPASPGETRPHDETASLGETRPQGVQPDHYWTWRLFAAGFSAGECAVIRGVGRNVIVGHALRALEDGLPVRCESCLSHELIGELDNVQWPPEPGRVRLILPNLPPGTTYDEVQLFLNCRGQRTSE
jgi:hypothetical protein